MNVFFRTEPTEANPTGLATVAAATNDPAEAIAAVNEMANAERLVVKSPILALIEGGKA